MANELVAVPWDAAVLGMNAWEISSLNETSLAYVKETPGHYCIRVDPLSDKKVLHEHGFYYCDTLIEPHCSHLDFRSYADSSVTIKVCEDVNEVMSICNSAFEYDRYHRDFNVPKIAADQRYNNWLKQLVQRSIVYAIYFVNKLSAFIAVQDSKFILHAVSPEFQGQGLAKRLWTPVCEAVWADDKREIVSSVSAANLAVVNLYASLGFRFRNSVDIYHRITA